MLPKNRIITSIRKSLIAPSKRRKQDFDEPLLVFTFDDAFLTDYEIAYPLMTSVGVKGTSFAVTNWVGGDGFCNWPQLLEMQQHELWDVQCHTKTHPDLSTLGSEQEIREQFEANDQAFPANGLIPPRYHAYPYGGNNQLVRQIGAEYRDLQRLTGRLKGGLNTRKSILEDPHGVINGMSVDMETVEQLNEIKDAIKWGYDTGKVIVLYCHQIKQAPDGYAYSITEHHLSELIHYIADLGVRTLTISELYEELFTA